MAIETSLKLRQKYFDPFMAVACVVFALWGAYDYFVAIPARESAARDYEKATGVKASIEERASKGGTATPEELKAYEEAKAVLQRFKDSTPTMPGAFDRAVQVWGYMVGCGLLGAPWCAWAWYSNSRRKYRVDDEGTLHAPEGAFPPEDIADIDMSRWMSKSIATLRTTDGKSIELDDYKYKNMHLIVGMYASKFHPADWTDDARDRHRLEAQQEAAGSDSQA